MEERLVALRIPFMSIQVLPCGEQMLLSGNIINVPVDIAPTVNVLPRSMSNTDVVAIKVKKKRYISDVNVRKIYDQWLSGKCCFILYTKMICIIKMPN